MKRADKREKARKKRGGERRIEDDERGSGGASGERGNGMANSGEWGRKRGLIKPGEQSRSCIRSAMVSKGTVPRNCRQTLNSVHNPGILCERCFA